MEVTISSVGGGVSTDSPLGSALLGATIGDVVEVPAPRGAWKARVLSIRRRLATPDSANCDNFCAARPCAGGCRALESRHLSRRAFGFAGSVFLRAFSAVAGPVSVSTGGAAPRHRRRAGRRAHRGGLVERRVLPPSWGALLLVVAIGLAAVAILADQVEVGRRTVVLAGALFALAAWQVVTTAWAVAPDAPLLEAERTLVYASAVLLALLAVPSRRATDLVLAVLVGAGAATVSGLLAHALGAGAPDERLELPLGYPNASGIVATTSLVLGLGLSTGRARLGRALGGGVAAPAAAALALSLSRGSILAAVLGILVLCLVTVSRHALGTVAIVGASGLLAVGIVSLAGRLRDDGAAPREALASSRSPRSPAQAAGSRLAASLASC